MGRWKEERTFFTAAIVCASPISALPPAAPPPYVDSGPFIFAVDGCLLRVGSWMRKKVEVDFLPDLTAFGEAGTIKGRLKSHSDSRWQQP
jgi:hypothetical protein